VTSRFTELAVDCHDPERLAAFCCEVLDFKVIDRSEGKVEIGSWVPTVEDVRARQMSCTLMFIQVPEGKPDEPTIDRSTPERRHNRLHLDLRVGDEPRAEIVARLIARGATKLWDGRQGPNTWVTMADPEGNEFCVA